MKTRRWMNVGVGLAAGCVLLAACGDSGSGSGNGSASDYDDMALVGSSQGGAGYTYMVAASQLFNNELDMGTTVQSGGTQENALLVASGELKFAITSPGDAIAATEDPSAVEDGPLRTIFNMFNVSALLLVPKDSTATGLGDLEGERIAIGIPGGGEYPLFYDSIDCLGMDEDDFDPQPIGKEEAAAAYKDGNVDAWLVQGPNPTPDFVEVMESPRGAKAIGLGQDVIDCLTQGDEFVESEIPADTYPDQTEALPTVDEWFYAVVNEDFPDDLAYDLTKTLAENHDQLVETYPGAATSTAENTANSIGFPLAPGSEKYLKEAGFLK